MPLFIFVGSFDPFEAWKQTAKGNTKEAKAVPPPPPPWFPPLDSLFRGAPSARNDQRGKPIPTTARKAMLFSPTWSLGEWRNPFVACPSGHGLCSILFSLAPAAKERPRWPPCGQSVHGAKLGEAGDFRPAKIAGAESPGLGYLSPARPCHKAASVSEHYGGFVAPSAPRGSTSRWLHRTQKQQVKRKGHDERKSRFGGVPAGCNIYTCMVTAL